MFEHLKAGVTLDIMRVDGVGDRLKTKEVGLRPRREDQRICEVIRSGKLERNGTFALRDHSLSTPLAKGVVDPGVGQGPPAIEVPVRNIANLSPPSGKMMPVLQPYLRGTKLQPSVRISGKPRMKSQAERQRLLRKVLNFELYNQFVHGERGDLPCAIAKWTDLPVTFEFDEL